MRLEALRARNDAGDRGWVVRAHFDHEPVLGSSYAGLRALRNQRAIGHLGEVMSEHGVAREVTVDLALEVSSVVCTMQAGSRLENYRRGTFDEETRRGL